MRSAPPVGGMPDAGGRRIDRDGASSTIVDRGLAVFDKRIDILNYIDASGDPVQPSTDRQFFEEDMHKAYSRSIPRQWRDIAKVFVAMGDAHRQRILLMFERGERLNVGQIADVSTLSRSAVSHHLKIMREAGVLGSEKIGKEVWFWVERDALLEALRGVGDYIAQNA
jgi:DNA-binding transcriptional ArsR family regulator